MTIYIEQDQVNSNRDFQFNQASLLNLPPQN